MGDIYSLTQSAIIMYYPIPTSQLTKRVIPLILKLGNAPHFKSAFVQILERIFQGRNMTKQGKETERHSASWHLTVMRAGERSARTCQCLSYVHAYSLFQNAIEMCEGYNVRN